MGSPELAQYADFYAEMTRRFGLTDSLDLWRDISERLHQLTPEPEDVTYKEVTANGVPAILITPAESSTDHILPLLPQFQAPRRRESNLVSDTRR
jgi:epsilon-lactone hydrolase